LSIVRIILHTTYSKFYFRVLVSFRIVYLHKKNLQNVFNSYFHGIYQFQDFLTTTSRLNENFKINKFQNHSFISYIKDIEKNTLTNESIKLKKYHIFLKNTLFQYMKVHKSVYSYRHDKSIYDLAKLHHENHNFFKTDIKGFFKHITPVLILNTLHDNIPKLPFDEEVVNYFDSFVDLVTVDDSLPAGYVTSPSISNTVLYNFDEAMTAYCLKHDICYSRYSDDLIFSSNDYKVLQKLPQIVPDILELCFPKSFKLNQLKTMFFDKTNKVTFLGICILPNGHITVDAHIKENIRQLLYYYSHDKEKFFKLLEKRFNNSLAKAYGSLNYINDIDKQFIVKLRKKYGNYLVDKFLHGVKQ